MTTIYKDTWFELSHDRLVRACRQQIRMLASFEVRVPKRDARRVRAALIAASPVGGLPCGWWARRARVYAAYVRHFRLARLLLVADCARHAAYRLFLFDQRDGLRIVFESTR